MKIEGNMKYTIEQIQNFLKTELSEKRFYHTIGVAHTAACLSMRYDCDITNARYAGMLHDCAKCLEDSEILKRCRAFSIPISETEERQPYLLHGKLSAYYAKTRFEIEEDDILNAISFHTTGRPRMSLLEKIVFIADYIEPGRKDIPGLSEIRRLVFLDLDKAIVKTLENTLNYLRSPANAANEIDPMTIEAYQYYRTIV